MTVAEIAPSLLALPEQDREQLMYVLSSSLPKDDGLAEALRRDAEMDEDPTKCLSHEQFMKHFSDRRSA